MTEEDHTLIAQTVGAMSRGHDGVVVTHGTDRLAQTGERVVQLLGTPAVPVVLTGAIRPYMLRNTDAIQNLTEALLAVQILSAGVYCVMHNKVLRFPGVIKDHGKGTFRYANEPDS
jgi:L-asparaginase